MEKWKNGKIHQLLNSYKINKKCIIIIVMENYYNSLMEKINNFDYIIYAGSLGRYFRNDLNSFSQNSYIKNLENYKDLELDNILSKTQGLKIGISWKSLNNKYSSEKSLSLEDFENIFKIKNNPVHINPNNFFAFKVVVSATFSILV